MSYIDASIVHTVPRLPMWRRTGRAA